MFPFLFPAHTQTLSRSNMALGNTNYEPWLSCCAFNHNGLSWNDFQQRSRLQMWNIKRWEFRQRAPSSLCTKCQFLLLQHDGTLALRANRCIRHRSQKGWESIVEQLLYERLTETCVGENIMLTSWLIHEVFIKIYFLWLLSNHYVERKYKTVVSNDSKRFLSHVIWC